MNDKMKACMDGLKACADAVAKVNERCDAVMARKDARPDLARTRYKKPLSRPEEFHNTKQGKHIARLEDRAYDQQYKHIKREHGEHAADNANYGHFVDGGEHHTLIHTKVYGAGENLSSHIDHKTGKISHEWS
jgi:hypothetical protein